jgi:hypoxanthine phosphoribosyltransferase
MHDDIQRVLFHETTILSRLDDMAHEIVTHYRDQPLTVVAVLNGSLFFMADLLRRIRIPLTLESLRAGSYHGQTTSSGQVKFATDLPDVRGRHVLVLDDILDSGRTLHAVLQRFRQESGALSVRTCVLLEKNVPRAEEVTADYVGFRIGDEFVVGYGLDFQEHYRNLPYIGVLHESVIAGGAAAAGEK